MRHEDCSDEVSPVGPRGMRSALVGLGTVFVGLAALGAILPLLPTTPFLLRLPTSEAEGA